MNITVTQADLDAAIAIAKDMGLETIPDALVRGVAGVRIAALEDAAKVAEESRVGQGDDEWDAGASCAKEEIAKVIRSLKEPNNG